MVHTDTRKAILATAFSVGGLGLVTQTSLFRELSIVLRSNDLIVGILLSIWLLFAGLGSVSSPLRARWFGAYIIQTFVAGLSVLWCHFLVNLFDPGLGHIWPFWRTVILIALSVGPIAYLTGAAFSAISRAFCRHGDPARIYITEGIGALLGGILSFALAPLIAPIIVQPILAGVSCSGIIIFLSGKRRATGVVGLALAFGLLPIFNTVDNILVKRIYSGYNMQRYESVHGAIQVSQRFDETYFFQGGVYLGASGDTSLTETVIHPVILARDNTRNVLLMGGVLQGSIRNLQRYEPDKITILIEDPKLLIVGSENFRSFRELAEPNIEVLTGEPIREIRNLDGDYDLVLLFPGIPQSSATGRMLSKQVFDELSTLLSDNGTIVVGFPMEPNLITADEAALLSSVKKAMSPIGQVTAYVADGMVTLVAPDNGDFGRSIRDLNTDSLFDSPLPSGMLKGIFEDYRQADLRHRIAKADAPQNSVRKPFALLLGLKRWETLAGGGLLRIFADISFGVWAGALMILSIFALSLAIYGKSIKAFIPAMSFLTGACGIGASIWLMYYFQIAAGQLYLAIGLLSSLFMLGSVLGARMASKGLIRLQVWRLYFLALIALILILDILEPFALPIWLTIIIFGSYNLFTGGIVGSLYPILLYKTDERSLFKSSGPGIIYGSDLLGSALSAPIFGLILIPVFGLTNAALFIILTCVLIMTISVSLRK